MNTLALLGGTPQRQQPYPAWPHPDEKTEALVLEAVRSGNWGDVAGPNKTALEQGFAEFHQAKHAIAVSNGTVSLEIALGALDIGVGDEVIVPGYTFFATASAVIAANARPVFVDVDEDTGCIDPEAVKAAITPRTRAVIPVHFAGHPADLDALVEICAAHDLALIEDAAQAHGAEYRGRRVGSTGDFGSFSFQASKNMSSGEGGLLVSNDDRLAELAWSHHHCGRLPGRPWYEHHRLGGNHRLGELASALLLPQLELLPERLQQREASARILDEGLASIEGLTAAGRAESTTVHAYHLYPMRFDSEAFGGITRERFVEALNAEGIPAGAGYGTPLNTQPVFAEHRFDTLPGDERADSPVAGYASLELPVTQRLCDEHVWLPQLVLLADADGVQDIVAAIGKVQSHVSSLR